MSSRVAAHRSSTNPPAQLTLPAKLPPLEVGLPKMLPQKVWITDPTHGFIPGEISDIHTDSLTVSVTQQNRFKLIQVSYADVHAAEDDSLKDYEDNCSLMYLNEATLLNNVKVRFLSGKIYSYIANMLIAVNPYATISNLYSPTTVKLYQGKSLGTLPPHVYAIGDKALRDMKVTKQSQSIIVSGESGAGKTESTKYILRYLCDSAVGTIEQRILDANPILESFGNAKTTRNNNSSRFGKFIEIHFDQLKVAGGFISHYLLEKSRVCRQSPNERNYHIFYELLQGLTADQKTNLSIDHPPQHFNYLKSGCCEYFGVTLKDPIVHDKNDFDLLQRSFANLQLSRHTDDIYRIVALVLLIGNIEFEDDPELTSKGGCRVVENTELKKATTLMGLELNDFIQALTTRVMQTSKAGIKGTVIQVPLKKYEAINARDALAKSIYNRLFDWIVKKINESIPFKNSQTYIGVLDIAGFEYFTLNSFEQFCINYCNEKLQQFFNERVLHDEQMLYEKEQLNVKKIDYVDNIDCIELIEGRPGIMSILDEESKLVKPTYTHFTSEVHKLNHFRLTLPRKSKIKEHREILDDQGFIIRHFAGAVCYDSKNFVEKNNDALHFSLEVLLQNCGNNFLQKLFSEIDGYKGKLGFVSVSGKFKGELGELLEKLRGTGTSFIRCIKPNSKMVGGVFEGGLILSQLQCAGMSSVLELMQGGFPSRVKFNTLYSTYATLLPPKLSKLDARFFCRALFKAVGLSEDDFRFGLTRVFFRPGKFKEFDQIMRSDSDNLKKMVEAVSKWIVVSKWKRVQFGVWSVVKLRRKIEYRWVHLVVMQKSVRMWLAHKQHRPRYIGLIKLKKLQKQVGEVGVAGGKLKIEREGVMRDVNSVENDIDGACLKIRTNPKLPAKEIDKLCENILQKTDQLMKSLEQRVLAEKNREEAERARKLREEMERVKKEQEEREREEGEEVERKRRKQELETLRKSEELKQTQLDLQSKNLFSQKSTTARDKEDSQDKRDTEMAIRLASLDNATVEEGALRRSGFVTSNKNKKHDLSGWKYSELRDAINTSCDVELLGACREEFHRRLKVYHAWKARNSDKKLASEKDAMERAPKSIYQYQKSHQIVSGGVDANATRFFRIPFTKDGVNRGLWYAEFKGEFVQRQMEVGDGGGVLLIAGRDDMQMCELKLSETGLTRKRGAEILEHDFQKEWAKWS